MAKPEQVAKGLVMFAENEILPQMDGLQQLLGVAAVIQFGRQAEALMLALREEKSVAILGLIDENGDINVNDAADSLKQAIAKTGRRAEIVLPIFGKIKLNENDIDKLREYINNA